MRMLCASFLVEYLGVSWVEGARWFHATLVDADVAINSMMWQNAGRSGIDQVKVRGGIRGRLTVRGTGYGYG